jgi:putative membrane protein
MRVVLVALGTLIAGVAFAQMRGSSLSKADQEFVNFAALIDDHKKVGDQLQQLSDRENFALPTEPNADQRATYERLSKLSGAEFDSALLAELKTDHERAISLFQQEAQRGFNPQLRNFAQSTLPSLQHHDQMVGRTMNKV